MSTSTASSEANRAATLEFLEQAWTNGDLSAYERFVSPDQVLHLAGYPEPFYGRDEAVAWVRTYQSAFHDLSLEIEAVLAEGDTVAVRLRTSATHRGEYLGVKPLGTRVSMLMLQMFRFADGKIVEVWLMFDPLNVMQQLGVFPPGPLPKPLLALINPIRRLRTRRRRKA